MTEDVLYTIDLGYGRTDGPYRLEQVRELLELARCNPDDRIQPAGGAWVKVSDLVPDAAQIHRRRASDRVRRGSDRLKAVSAVPQPVKVDPPRPAPKPIDDVAATVQDLPQPPELRKAPAVPAKPTPTWLLGVIAVGAALVFAFIGNAILEDGPSGGPVIVEAPAWASGSWEATDPGPLDAGAVIKVATTGYRLETKAGVWEGPWLGFADAQEPVYNMYFSPEHPALGSGATMRPESEGALVLVHGDVAIRLRRIPARQ